MPPAHTLSPDEFDKDINALRLPSGVWDVNKLISRISFPVYILAPESVNCSVALDTLSRVGSSITKLLLAYSFPPLTSHSKFVRLMNATLYPGFEDSRDWLAELFFSTMGNLPQPFLPPFDWGKLHVLWHPFHLKDYDIYERQVEQLFNQVLWEPYTVGELSYNLFHDAQSGKLSVAYSLQKNNLTALAMIGMTLTESRFLLGSLVHLQGETRTADEFQKQLNAAKFRTN